MAEPAKKIVAALWAFDNTDRYPAQFVGAVSESLADMCVEEADRLRALAEEWFVDFGNDEPGRWTFEVVYHQIDVPTRTEA